MEKRDIVRSVIDHKETEEIPYFITFTPEARKKIEPYFEGEDLSLSIGNYVYPISCPWWDWYDLPEYYKDYDAPDSLPKTRGYGSYEAFKEKLAYIKETTSCYILVTIYGSHFKKAYFARGIENFLADLVCNKGFAKDLLDMIIRKNMVMLENILTFPEIDGVLLGSDWGSQKSLLMSPNVWRELIAPGELKEYNLLKDAGKDVWIHSCGNIEAIIPDLIDMGVDVLNPLQPECMDIFGLKQRYGSKLTFWGGVSTQQTLPYGTTDEVKNEVEKVVSFMSKGGGYITASSQDIQGDVPVENILALIETAKSFTNN